MSDRVAEMGLTPPDGSVFLRCLWPGQRTHVYAGLVVQGGLYTVGVERAREMLAAGGFEPWGEESRRRCEPAAEEVSDGH